MKTAKTTKNHSSTPKKRPSAASVGRATAKTRKTKSVDALERAAKGDRANEDKYRRVDYKTLLPLGSRLLNLVFSGRGNGALPRRMMVRGFGESGSGKSYLMCTLLAEAAIHPLYKKYRLIYNDVEEGAQFDARMFGPEFVRRVEWENSETIEKCYSHIAKVAEEGPCIYIVDSLDALSAAPEKKKFEALKKADGEVGEGAGEMTDGKAKANSKYLRQVRTALTKHDSILILISQVRDVLNSPIPGQKSVSGGKSVKFYAACEFSIQRKGSIKRSIHGEEREIGILSELRIVKNRMYGTTGALDIPILHSHGIDHIGMSIDWLCKEGVFTAKKTEDKKGPRTVGNPRVTAPGISKKDLTREQLIRFIDEDDARLVALGDIVEKRWKDIRDGIRDATPRKSRYGEVP